MTDARNNLIQAILELKEVKRIKELEKIIDNDNNIKNKFIELKNCQKQIVNSKHLGLINNTNYYEEEYNKIREELLDYPFMEEYLDLLEEVDLMLKNICETIQAEINKNL